MSKTPDELVESYLQDLRRALGDLPKERRREVVDEVAEHIAESRAGLPVESEVEIRNLLERVGDPEEIAAEARERFGVRPRETGIREISAIVLLLVGGFVFGIGWFVGVVLLWASEAWTTRDKLIGTFIVPGGLASLMYVLWFGLGAGESCGRVVDAETGAVVSEVCTGGPSLASQILGGLLLVVFLVGPFFTTIYLALRLRRPGVASAEFVSAS